ncbi:MAG TPA: hypothetical protein EYQ50_18320 [Verrucomicrobiales bacterium]|nr:hypothetical protein [Verrucomicrobiales bacterium]
MTKPLIVTMKSKLTRISRYVSGFLVVQLLIGCAAYITPGSGINLESIRDKSIREQFEKEPAAPFPATIAVVRVQQSGYYSMGNEGHGIGVFSVVTTRDVEKDEHFKLLTSLPQVAGIAPLNRLVIPARLRSVEDLRFAAAGLHSDMLLLYTIDTSFKIKNRYIRPLTQISLGFLPNKEASVRTIVSSILYDVRTGFIYGLTEASGTTSVMANTWSKKRLIEKSRLLNEEKTFDGFVTEFTKTWSGVILEYHNKRTSDPSN